MDPQPVPFQPGQARHHHQRAGTAGQTRGLGVEKDQVLGAGNGGIQPAELEERLEGHLGQQCRCHVTPGLVGRQLLVAEAHPAVGRLPAGQIQRPVDGIQSPSGRAGVIGAAG